MRRWATFVSSQLSPSLLLYLLLFTYIQFCNVFNCVNGRFIIHCQHEISLLIEREIYQPDQSYTIDLKEYHKSKQDIPTKFDLVCKIIVSLYELITWYDLEEDDLYNFTKGMRNTECISCRDMIHANCISSYLYIIIVVLMFMLR